VSGEKEILQAIPFMMDQLLAQLDACDRFDEYCRNRRRGGDERAINGAQLHALINLNSWVGFAIGDGVNLPRHRLSKDNILQVRRYKTQDHGDLTWITLRLPDHIAEELRALPDDGSGMFFSLKARPTASRKNRNQRYASTLKELWSTVQWPTPLVDASDEQKPIVPHSHMFRHTAAFQLLNIAGEDIHFVQRVLGHKRLETTLKYLHFVPGTAEKMIADSEISNRKRMAAMEAARNKMNGVAGEPPAPEPPAPTHPHHVRVRFQDRARRAMKS
jgi:integrase